MGEESERRRFKVLLVFGGAERQKVEAWTSSKPLATLR
jgi:hypothetical protein